MIYFSPEQDPLSALLALVNGAQHTIRISEYAFTIVAYADALIAAHKRGVDVQALIDSSQTLNPTQHALVAHLRAAGVPTLVGTSSKGSLLHSKYRLFDGLATVHGSWNASNSASSQDNTCEFVQDAARAAAFLAHWQRAHDYIAVHPHALPMVIEEI